MKYTFGNTRACQTLETLLDGDKSARRKVSRLLSGFTSKLFNITGAKDPETVLTCMELLRAQTLDRVNHLQGLSGKVRSYTRNVIIYRYRKYREAFESLIPTIRKMIEKDRLTKGGNGV